MSRGNPAPGQLRGLTLIELLIALALSSLLALGVLRIAAASLAGHRLQDALAAFQEHGHVATHLLRESVRSAGFDESPWSSATMSDPFDGSADGGPEGSDHLVVWGRSDRNCFGSLNAAAGSGGHPRYDHRRFEFSLSSDRALKLDCAFGPDPSSLVRQVRGQRILKDVETLQVLLGEDADGDGRPDRWIRVDERTAVATVVAVQLGLLLASAEHIAEHESQVVTILDEPIKPPPDGRLRRALTLTVGVEARMP